jgi:hypothetical protein
MGLQNRLNERFTNPPSPPEPRVRTVQGRDRHGHFTRARAA